ncbi:MAG TPA: hypothetical protein VJ276_04745 [Thermoanaerobaculia bacterium]|nr:hypothetical protein [Thermoanaerobaculia bacterium]
MRSLLLPMLLLLGAASVRASDIRDLINNETKAKTAMFTMGDKINFFFAGGMRDTNVLLRAFPGTRGEVIRRAKASAPDCAQLDHLVFGGWWTTGRRLTFNYRFTEWALAAQNAEGDGVWVFIFEVQPPSDRMSPAGLLGTQQIEIKQADVDEYFDTGLEVTVFNDRPVTTVSGTYGVQPASVTAPARPTPSGPRANTIPPPELQRLVCTIAHRILPGTMQVASAPSAKVAAILLARARRAEGGALPAR